MPNYIRLHLLWLPGLLAALFLALLCTIPAHAQGINDGLVGYWPFDEGNGSTSADHYDVEGLHRGQAIQRTVL